MLSWLSSFVMVCSPVLMYVDVMNRNGLSYEMSIYMDAVQREESGQMLRTHTYHCPTTRIMSCIKSMLYKKCFLRVSLLYEMPRFYLRSGTFPAWQSSGYKAAETDYSFKEILGAICQHHWAYQMHTRVRRVICCRARQSVARFSLVAGMFLHVQQR